MVNRSSVITIIILALLVFSAFPFPAAAEKVSASPNRVEVIRSDASGVILEFSAPDYSIEEVDLGGRAYQKLIVPGADYLDDPAQAQSPVVTALLGVPGEAVLGVTIIAKDSETLPGHYNLLPSMTADALDQDLQPGKYIYKRSHDPDIFSRGLYPERPVQVLGDAWLRNQRVVQVGFTPFQFDPGTGSLVWNKSLRVEIKFALDTEQLMHPGREIQTESNPFDSILKRNLWNYETSESFRADPETLVESLTSPVNTCISDSLSNGTVRYRIPIDHDGIYRLTYEVLASAGVPVAGMDLQSDYFHLTNQGREVAIFTHDVDSNNLFNSGDYILFYGQHFDGSYLAEQCYAEEDANWRSFASQDIYGNSVQWNPEFNATMIEKYTDQNVYWLEINNSTGSPMQSLTNETGSASLPETYRSVLHEEQSNTWHTFHFTSEDTWFWEKIDVSASETRVYTTTVPVPASGEHTAIFRGEIVAKTDNPGQSPDHNVLFYLNDPSHLDPLVELNWDGKSANRFEVSFPQSRLQPGENRLDLVANKLFGEADQLYFNWFEIEYQREFTALANQIWFEGPQSGKWKYVIDGFSGVTASDIWVFKISENPLQPVFYLNVPFSNNQVEFTVTHEAGAEFYVGVAEDVPATEITAYQPLDLTGPVEYLIITHPDLLQASQELADFRSMQGLSTHVYNLDQIIAEFNFGIYHPIAIKNFIRYTFDNWQTAPVYVLLIGDGHWNFKGYSTYNNPTIFMPPNLSWVDPWQGEVDSANLLAAVVGDDPLADVMIARLPVNSGSQLSSVIDKVKQHESLPAQAWQRHFLYVADNTPDPAGNFVASAEKLITDFISLGYSADRIYLDNYMDTGSCGAYDGTHGCPAGTQALITQMNEVSAQFVNYFGHAGVDFWAGEKLLVNQDVSQLTNGARLPVFLSSTCLDGYWIHPNKSTEPAGMPSLIENLIVAEGRGAVGAFSSTGLGVSTGHDYLQEGFYNAVFHDQATTLGLASMEAKMNLFQAGIYVDLLHTFTVFGDPALGINLQPVKINYLPLVLH